MAAADPRGVRRRRVARGLVLVASGLAWLVLSLGLRAFGLGPAARALRDAPAAAASLAALALTGWPLALCLSITADPAYDESYYFLQASGLLLWLFALPGLAAFAAGALWRGALVLLLTLPATAELVVRRALAEPERIPPPAVRAMTALRAASCPGDVVITRPGVALVPTVVVLAGRRVPLASFIPYWRQFTTSETVAAREAAVLSFFRADGAKAAIEAAREVDVARRGGRARARPRRAPCFGLPHRAAGEERRLPLIAHTPLWSRKPRTVSQ